MAAGAVCATVLGLLASQLLRAALDGTSSGLRWGLLRLFAAIGDGVPAALTCGLVAGAVAALTLRVAVGRAENADATTPSVQGSSDQP